MTGKQKCRILRQIRRDIAAANQLDYTERECTHQGECSGTCPYCETQLKRLEGELAARRSLGRRIAVMGLSMGLLAINLSSCDDLLKFGKTLQGDMAAPESNGTEQVSTQTLQGEPEYEAVTAETLMGDIIAPPDTTAASTTERDVALAGMMPFPVTLPAPDETQAPETDAVTEASVTP